jgi:hypothetical protein
VTELDDRDLKDLSRVGVALWNKLNDCKAIKAGKLFGWAPKEGSLRDEIPEIVRSEAELLGLTKPGL